MKEAYEKFNNRLVPDSCARGLTNARLETHQTLIQRTHSIIV